MHDVGRIRPSAHSDLDHRHIHLHTRYIGARER
jgi:hypothetical protein